MVSCATWELANLLQCITSVYCARWMSQLQGFGFPKLLTRKRRLLSILFQNLRFTRTNGRYRFFENQWTFGYCIQISKDLDTISKSLKIFMQFFIGYPNACTCCGIQAVSCIWLYELLMSLRTSFTTFSPTAGSGQVNTLCRLHNKVAISALRQQYASRFIWHLPIFTVILTAASNFVAKQVLHQQVQGCPIWREIWG